MMSRNPLESDDSDGGWGSDEFDEDYVSPEAYEQPMPDVRVPHPKRPLPAPPPANPRSPSGQTTPPRPPERRRVPPIPDQISPSNRNSGPNPLPVPPGRRLPNNETRRPPAPSPPNITQRAPSFATPPPLPPGRGRVPPAAPETPRFPPTPVRPVDDVPKRYPLTHQPSEEVYEVPDVDAEDYEELPQDDPPKMPMSRLALSNTPVLPPPPPPGRRSPRPLLPDPSPEPPNNGMFIGADQLNNIKLRKTGGPQNKQLPAVTNPNDPDKRPGFNTIKQSFQTPRASIPYKRSSIESNHSSEESSGSGEFQAPQSNIPPKLPPANPVNWSNQQIPRLPSQRAPCSPNLTPSPPTDALLSYNWYFGEMPRGDADCKVQFKQDGTFLVRRSKKGGDTNPYTLVVWCESKVWNVHLRLRSDSTYAVGSAREGEQTFNTIPELIEHHKTFPILLANERGGRRVGQTKLIASPAK